MSGLGGELSPGALDPIFEPPGGGGTLHFGGGGNLNSGVAWGLGSKSGLLETLLLTSGSTENLRVGEVSRTGGVQTPTV